MSKALRYSLLFSLIALIAVTIIVIELSKAQSSGPFEEIAVHISEMSPEEKAEIYEPAKEITTPDAFINVDDITISELIGEKVILVDFWTYSCINCQRTTPFLNAWHDAYEDEGLVILGIHTPEFAFEEKLENVQEAVERFEIEYPVILDNDYSTWRAYQNRFWPRKYLIDIDGFIVYDHIGEGAYDETEAKIVELLQERAERLGESDVAGEQALPEGVKDVDFREVNTPEIYFGSARNEHLNDLYSLEGNWNTVPEFAVNVSDSASINLSYDAKDVYMVAAADGEPVEVTVILDGEVVQTITVKEEQLYELILGDEYGPHELRLEINGVGLEAFTFTFG